MCPLIQPKSEGVLGTQYNLRMFRTFCMEWYRGGTSNPIGISARDLGTQYGFCYWSAEQNRWICPSRKGEFTVLLGVFNLCSRPPLELVVTCVSAAVLSVLEVRLVATGLTSVYLLQSLTNQNLVVQPTSVYDMSQV